VASGHPVGRLTVPATWETVAAILSELPGTEPDPAGVERVRVRGRSVAYLAGNERSRPAGAAAHEEFVVVRCTYEEREALLAQDPGTFHVTPHYRTYPGVIVRLATVDPDQLRELLVDAWRLVAPKRLVRGYDAGR
jgi:hypothetical protein